jgi:PhzF family phenazine biosynthesis protein
VAAGEAAVNIVYHLVNVFGRETSAFSGNPLCVVEPGAQLSDGDKQALARQFNLSETVFLSWATHSGAVADADADAHVRIFTPDGELPFAGHPTLGSAFMVSRLLAGETGATRIRLKMPAGVVPVEIDGVRCRLTAAPPVTRPVSGGMQSLAMALGLEAAQLGYGVAPGVPAWINTGTEQLIVPLRTVDDVRRVRPDYVRLAAFAGSERRPNAYVFAMSGPHSATARYFFPVQGVLHEDPATGSACANLGGWWLSQAGSVPWRCEVSQGEQLERPSTLLLEIDDQRQIHVGGQVRYLGRGELSW